MILEELCRFFGIEAGWNTRQIFPKPARLELESCRSPQDAIRSFVLRAYDILADDRRLRAVRTMTADAAAHEFDRLRNGYVHRPEFRHYLPVLPPGMADLEGTLRSLGFRTARDMSPEGEL